MQAMVINIGGCGGEEGWGMSRGGGYRGVLGGQVLGGRDKCAPTYHENQSQ